MRIIATTTFDFILQPFLCRLPTIAHKYYTDLQKLLSRASIVPTRVAIRGLPEPRPNQPYIEVSALEAGILQVILTKFLEGAQPGESTICPSLSFPLRHSVTREHLVFDLGIRRDMEVHPPAVQKSVVGCLITTLQSVDESLKKGGIDPAEVGTVIANHLHYDHVGDASAFPKATFIMGYDAEGISQRAGLNFPSFG
ncbi:hypothetical protein C8Q74DRAFT_1218905 [Fomes fomentarius]|nr:hypothetical protein C8Q74DRAFT_1218905 [Fomes fomentarius]